MLICWKPCMMGDLEVLAHRQIVLEGDHETSIKVPQRERAARGLDRKLDKPSRKTTRQRTGALSMLQCSVSLG